MPSCLLEKIRKRRTKLRTAPTKQPIVLGSTTSPPYQALDKMAHSPTPHLNEAPAGGLVPPQEQFDYLHQVSLSRAPAYARMPTVGYRAQSTVLLGQTNFDATLNQTSHLVAPTTRRDSNEGITVLQSSAISGPPGSAITVRNQGGSFVSQLLLPLPSPGASEFRSPSQEDSRPVTSKKRKRLYWVIFYSQKLLSEIIGTLFLVTSIALADKGSHASLGPFSVSAVVYVLDFLFLPISGAHFNPAVSAALVLTSRHFSLIEFFSYVLCQLLGATVGALVGWAIMGVPLEITPLDLGQSSARQIFHEVIPTMLLIYTCLVLTFATHAGELTLLTIPMTISMVVLFGAVAGATMNPAVTAGIYLSHCIWGSCDVMGREVLIGIFCPYVGALLSVLGFLLTHAYTHPIEIRFVSFT